MRVVVTGASGNVGTGVLDLLIADGAVSEIIGICRRRPDIDLPKVSWRPADVAVDRLEPLFDGADAVIHLAWQIQPARDLPRLTATNVGGTARVAAAVVATGVSTLVHASSVGAYAPGPKHLPVDESWPVTGVTSSFYSRHKSAAERIIRSLATARPDLRVVTIRSALVFKAGAASGVARLFLGPLAPLRLIGRRWPPLVPANDRLVFQAVDGHDAAAAYVAALRAPRSGAFNVAAEGTLGGADLGAALKARPVPVPASLLRLAAAGSFRAHLQPTPPGWVDLALAVPTLATDAARTELGWRPSRTAAQALDDLLTGFAQRAGMATPPLEPRPGGRLIPFAATPLPTAARA